MKIRKSLFSLLCLSALGLSSGSAEAATADVASWSIAKYPLYVGSAILPPLVMILMGRDHGMYYEAYNDMTDLDGDGKIDFIFNPAVVYDGLFESNYCYSYTNNTFKIEGLASSQPVNYHGKESVVYTCSNQWSGNFLNYVTTSRMDLVKRILIGGQRAVQSGTAKSKTARKDGYPYIIRQWIPHDTHVWAKAFNPADYNANGGQYCPLGHGNCTIDKWTTYASNQGLMLGNVQRRMHVIPFTCSRTDGDGNCTNGKSSTYKGYKITHTLGSYTMVASFTENQANARQNYIDNRIFVWNWLARESGIGGGVSEEGCSGSTCKTKYTAPGGAVTTEFVANTYNVAVESCNPSNVGIDNLSSRCKKYTDKYNTVGLLQQFSDTPSVDAYFGLITSGWNRTTDGYSFGVLRAPVLSLYDMIDEKTGDFKETDGTDRSVLSVINTLALQKENASLNSGNTSGNWSNNCTIDSTHKLRVYERGCVDWGNPLSQLITLSHDYFENHLSNSVGQNGTGNETIKSRTSWSANAPIDDVKNMRNGDVTIPGLKSARSPFTRDSIYECQKPINLILLDENISMDWKGGDTAAIDQGLAIIDASEHFSGHSYVFGENTTSDAASAIKDYQTLPTLKKIEDLAALKNVRGVSVLEPQMSGSLNGPAVAAAYYANRLSPVGLTGDKATAEYSSLQNVVVAMASFLPQFTIKAANGKSVLFIPTCKTPQLNGVKYYYPGQSDQRAMYVDYGTTYTTSCGIGDVFFVDSQYDDEGNLAGVEFRVTYEDNDGGSDFDMDVAASYKITRDPDDPNVLDVEINGYYSDGYAPMILGYVIIGTQGVNYFDHATQSWKTDAGRTVFYDITKASSSGNSQSIIAIQSDPFYEANNTKGVIDLNERLWRPNGADFSDNISQTVMIDSSAGSSHWTNNTGKSNGDARHCFEDNVWFFHDQGIAPMIINKPITNWGQFVWSMLPRVGAYGGGVPMYCSSKVKRKFMVTGTEGAFLPSPLELTAKYGYRNTSLSNYYYVTNAATLADNITAAMKATLAAGNRSSTALTFPSAEVSSDSAETVMASFDTEYWTGEVKKVTLAGFDDDDEDAKISVASQVWSASDNISSMSPTDRKIYLANSSGQLVPFTAEAILSGNFPRLYQGILNAFNIPSSCSDQMGEFVERYVSYVRGDATYELSEEEEDTLTPALTCGDTKAVLGFHKRNGKILGTVINSTPQVVTNSYGRYVIFAANDGMIHILKEDTGEEILAVVPYVGQYDMPKAALRGDITRYILDGEFNVYSAQVGSEQRYIAYGSRGLAFPGAFALDLTDLGNSEKSVTMLWELSKTEEDEDGVIRAYNGLGTFNAPITVFPFHIVDADRWVLLAAFGNGYNSSAADTYNPENAAETSYDADGSSSLVVVNALSGSIKKVLSDPYWGKADCNRDNDHPELYTRFKNDAGACYSNGMNVTAAGFDPNHDLSPDYLYTTDLYGNLYRVRLVGKDVSDWSMSRIYTTVYSYQEGSTDKYQVQAITTKPSIAGNKANKPVLIVGTGKYLTSDDVVDDSMQSIYALEDSNYANESSVITPSCRGDSSSPNLTCLRTATKLPLYKMSMGTLVTDSPKFQNFRSIIQPKDNSGKVMEYDSDLYAGWVIDMAKQPGERVIVNSTVQEHRVYVTTMVPTDNPCAGGGTGHMYDLNVLSGSFSKSPEESQLYSKTIMSRATTAYSRPSSEGGTGSSGEGSGSGDSCTGTDCKIRKRTGTELSCTKVHVATQTNGDGVEMLSGPKYCPRVESWQYIFE